MELVLRGMSAVIRARFPIHPSVGRAWKLRQTLMDVEETWSAEEGALASRMVRQPSLASSRGVDRRKELAAEPAADQRNSDGSADGEDGGFQREPWVADLHAENDGAGGEADA